MVHLGIDKLQESNFAVLANKRVGLMTNTSATNRDLISTYDIFRQAENVHLTALFGPEHGFSGAEADGKGLDSSVDHRTGLPIYSLYGETCRPTQEMLQNVDVIVCDIPDVGVRYYTFLWTVSYILEACGEHGVEVIILDRPNPLGNVVRGDGLTPDLLSFVGRFPIPIQHGMTLGELAQMINAVWNSTPAEVTVIPCEGWSREMLWDETDLIFVSPSPNLPHFSTNLNYPGSCLIEGTTLSEGRGAALPFEIVGAPYIDGSALAEKLNAYQWPGVRFRPHFFQPTFSKYEGQSCGGVQAHVIDQRQYNPLQAWLGIIREIRHMYPDDFAWLPSYRQSGLHHFDRLVGSPTVRQWIDDDLPLCDLFTKWEAFCEEFRELRQPYLLY